MLRRRAWVVILTVIVTTGAVVGLSLLQEDRYTATASLLFRDAGIDEQFANADYQPPRNPDRDAETNRDLVELEVVAAKTAEAVGRRFTAGDVSEHVEVSSRGQSDLVKIEAEDPSPKFAALLANTFARTYIAYRRDADRQKVSDALALVERQRAQLEQQGDTSSPLVQDLQAQAQSLRVLESLQTGNTELAQAADVPTTPSSPKPRRNGLIAAFAGLLLGLALALVLEQLDRRLKTEDELSDAFGLPILGSIPRSPVLRGRSLDPSALPAAEAEAFRMLRANLSYFNASRSIRSVLVTSSTPGSGKTTAAINLAAAEAETGSRVLLLEADVRQPTLTERLDVPASPGLTAVLAGHAELSTVIHKVTVAPAAGNGRGATLSVDLVVAGAIPPNPTELIESERFGALLTDVTQRYDLVVLDTPPIGIVSDAIPLLGQVSGVVIVSRLRTETRDSAQRLSAQLRALRAPALGVVANFAGWPRVSGYYDYGYGRALGEREPAALG